MSQSDILPNRGRDVFLQLLRGQPLPPEYDHHDNHHDYCDLSDVLMTERI